MLNEETISMATADNLMQYVVTNNSGIYGAVALLFPDVFEEIAKKLDSDLCILPLSIHELIIMKKSDELDLETLTNMVKEVNDTEVQPKDILSYSIYGYVRGSGTVEILKKELYSRKTA